MIELTGSVQAARSRQALLEQKRRSAPMDTLPLPPSFTTRRRTDSRALARCCAPRLVP